MMFGNGEQEQAIGLAELAGMIEGVISSSFERGFWVKAEMAKLNLYPESGHCYPDLVEKEGRNIRAQMRGTIWAGNYQRISKRFLEVAREPLKDGLEILFFATVRFHPQYGLSLQISDIDPTFTLGKMARDRLETLRRLKEEDLYDHNRTLPLPLLPKRIAVISVKTSKGFSDFINILESHAKKYRFHVELYPALLQGDRAVDSIREQLKKIRNLSTAFDAVAIIRGGGGEVGMSCYDDYRLAREVAAFPLPVITGIGHSTNETVVEMVAARNKITPTDVAYYLVEQFEAFEERLDVIWDTFFRYASNLLAEKNELLQHLAGKLEKETLIQMETQRSQLDNMLKNTLQQTRLRLRSEKEKLATTGAILRLSPKRSVQGEQERLNHKITGLLSLLKNLSDKEKGRLQLAESRVRLLDPVNTLKRGFSITYLNNQPLKDAAGISPGDMITTKLFKGILTSKINAKEE